MISWHDVRKDLRRVVGRILVMSLDARMRTIARQEIDTAPGRDVPEVAELRQQIVDLHAELHAVATRVAELEKQAEPKVPGFGQTEAAPAARRARKTMAE